MVFLVKYNTSRIDQKDIMKIDYQKAQIPEYGGFYGRASTYQSGMRLPDGRSLYTAPCGIRSDHRDDASHFT